MKYDKIMAGGNLEDIMSRLLGCCSVLDAIRWSLNTASGESAENALYGATDLLRSICRDFQADIDAAEDYTGKEAQS